MNGLRYLAISALLVTVVGHGARAEEERPSAMRLFPAETIAMLRVANIADMRDRFDMSSAGYMLRDPEVAPFVSDVIDTAKSQFDENLAEESGFESADLSLLPRGEMAFAMVDTGANEPAIIVLIDWGEDVEAAEKLIEKILSRAQIDGATVINEQIGSDDGTIIRNGDDADRIFGFVMRDGCMIGSNEQSLLELTLARWDAIKSGVPFVVPGPGEAEIAEDGEADGSTSGFGQQSLAENRKFVSILRECSGQLTEPPQALFYIDPIQVFRVTARSSGGMRVALLMLPQLGLDGLEAVGGTMSMSTGEWDTLIHAHVLLENPRAGVINLVRFQETDHAPPTYLPLTSDQYASIAVDPIWMFDEIAKLYDRFMLEGSFRKMVTEGPSEAMEMDLEKELLPKMEGRMVTATGYEWPVDSFTGQHRIMGMPMKSADDAKEVVEHFANKFENVFSERDYGGIEYYRLGEGFEPPEDAPERRRRRREMFSPSVAVIDNSVVISTSENLLRQCIDAHTGTGDRLSDAIEYRLIKSRIERMTRGRQLSMLQFNRPEVGMRYWYDMVSEGTASELLGNTESEVALAFRDSFERNPLPSFDTLQKYLAPGGGFLLDTDTGFHYVLFGMRREIETDE